MPSKNMLPKGHRHRSVRSEYVATRGVEPVPPPDIPLLDFDLYSAQDDLTETGAAPIRRFNAPPEAAGLRLDQYLAHTIPDISRARVHLLIDNGQVRVNASVAKPKYRLVGGEHIQIQGAPRPAPLNATPEDIPLDIVFEDEHLAVVNKPAGMMVHAGAGAPTPDPTSEADPSPHGAAPDPRHQGTLVNALLHHCAQLSGIGGGLRPGIVHRLDKQTSGLLLVAKDDLTHRRLGEMFAERRVDKTYLALAHGTIARDNTTIILPIGRDLVRRTRMTTRRQLGTTGVRSAVSHIHVLERLTTPFGPFTLVEVAIETGRTHQIRVHLQSMGHPVVGDHLYGAPHSIHLAPPAKPTGRQARPSVTVSPVSSASLSLDRNFLHAARLAFTHPRTGAPLAFTAPMPEELEAFLAALKAGPANDSVESTV
jgi:23S rRNA pseudouridine1911/1915/1917 synthase